MACWTDGPSEITNVPRSVVYVVYYLPFPRNTQSGSLSIEYQDPGVCHDISIFQIATHLRLFSCLCFVRFATTASCMFDTLILA